jgi:hypothetical protein
MKKAIVLLGILGIYIEINAEDIFYKHTSKSEMILDAKHLLFKQKMLQNKKAAWQKRVVGLIEDFYTTLDTKVYFGEKNAYGKARQERREKEFYSSLQAQSEEIDKKLLYVNHTLKQLKKEFYYLYARPLTKEEVEGKVASKVVQKSRKIELLKAYIASQNSWRRCFNRNKSFDEKRLEIENRVLDEQKYRYLSEHLDQKIEQNFNAMDSFSQKASEISQAYKILTGTALKDIKTAKLILRHIKEGD